MNKYAIARRLIAQWRDEYDTRRTCPRRRDPDVVPTSLMLTLPFAEPCFDQSPYYDPTKALQQDEMQACQRSLAPLLWSSMAGLLSANSVRHLRLGDCRLHRLEFGQCIWPRLSILGKRRRRCLHGQSFATERPLGLMGVMECRGHQ
jgi:hypothetical protein